jgi:group II intron reverse transcriptase/maturase
MTVKETLSGEEGPVLTVLTSLLTIASKAQALKRHRFLNLYKLIDENLLLYCWRDIRKNAAYGVDRVSAQQYAENLILNIRTLVERLKRKSYRARLVRRHYIPKPDGRLRPLGIPVVEDKLLQLAVTRLLEAIYERDFLDCSYGYRPNRGALDAVDVLTRRLQFGRYNFVVEADIKGFFDNIDHDRLIELLSLRIADRSLLRLIKKWLKAGVLDTDGKVIHPATGSPQGGIVSPILANVYLHYALDLWFQMVVKANCRGKAFLIRYADDFVCAFQYEDDAQAFYKALEFRLDKFGLQLAADKTRVIRFSRFDKPGSSRFDFLGFEFFWGRDRARKPHLKRRTSRNKLRNSLANFTVWCKKNRHRRLRVLFPELNRKLRGYYNYYGIIGNSRGLSEFYSQATRILFKWLNRRSQRHSFNWQGFHALLDYYCVPRPRIVHRPPIAKPTVTS